MSLQDRLYVAITLDYVVGMNRSLIGTRWQTGPWKPTGVMNMRQPVPSAYTIQSTIQLAIAGGYTKYVVN